MCHKLSRKEMVNLM